VNYLELIGSGYELAAVPETASPFGRHIIYCEGHEKNQPTNDVIDRLVGIHLSCILNEKMQIIHYAGHKERKSKKNTLFHGIFKRR
jgi:hypothetical protein